MLAGFVPASRALVGQARGVDLVEAERARRNGGHHVSLRQLIGGSMSRACPATAKHRTQNGRLTSLGTVIFCSSGTPAPRLGTISRTRAPSVAFMGITPPGQAPIRAS